MRKMSKCAAKAVGRQQKYYALHFQREGIVPVSYTHLTLPTNA